MSQQGCDIGLIGLGTMGRNFVLNMADHGFAVAVYNRTAEKTKDFMENEVGARPIQAGYDLQEFVGLLQPAPGHHPAGGGRRPGGCGDPGTFAVAGARRSHHRRRQLPFHRHQPARPDSCPGNSSTLWAWGSPAGKPGPAMAPA